MNATSEFKDIKLRPRTLGYYYVKKSILESLKRNSKVFSGTILDVGCGDMPYKSLLKELNPQVKDYIGMDIKYEFATLIPDVYWDGGKIPFKDDSIDTVILTEVLEHCPNPEVVLSEIHRVLKPNGCLFLTVPFLWMLHEVPHDEYRYTPFALNRHLNNSGFNNVKLESLGGWNASLAQMIAMWLEYKKRPRCVGRVLKVLLFPFYLYLIKSDRTSESKFGDLTMITGISGIAKK